MSDPGSSEMRDKLLVGKIERGTVIDHVPAWKADLVFKALHLGELTKAKSQASVAMLQNVKSKRLGRKDLIKIDGWLVEESEADILSLIFPTITINYVKRWRVSKYTSKIPDAIEARVKCPELRCISNAEREPVTSKLHVMKERRLLQCHYCDTLVEFERIPDLIKT